jgi:adenylate kinase
MPETIKKRMMVFQDLTQPLISYYHAAGVLEKVNGDEPVDLVSKDIFAVLDGVAQAK